jgi:hypothetical protein
MALGERYRQAQEKIHGYWREMEPRVWLVFAEWVLGQAKTIHGARSPVASRHHVHCGTENLLGRETR